MRGQEEEASRDRLEGYFFGELWRNVPEKAQGRLVDVDRDWLDKSRGRDYGPLLNDLQVAAEVICHSFIWEPLRSDRRLQRIQEKDQELRNDGRSPTISNYVWACKDQGFREFVQEQVVDRKDQQFLFQRLPKALRKLSELRNPAQHDPERRMRREEVEPLVKWFMGIDQRGVLRSLVEVGQKLVSK